LCTNNENKVVDALFLSSHENNHDIAAIEIQEAYNQDPYLWRNSPFLHHRTRGSLLFARRSNTRAHLDKPSSFTAL
jgi:hypothetical protein